tara:strand:+ start:7110 stop:7484 length:375 start_codon:yes stop_codon:yes gene_type:complete
MRLLCDAHKSAFGRLDRFACSFTPDGENLIAEAISEVVRRPWAFASSNSPMTTNGMVNYLTGIVANLGRKQYRREVRLTEILQMPEIQRAPAPTPFELTQLSDHEQYLLRFKAALDHAKYGKSC